MSFLSSLCNPPLLPVKLQDLPYTRPERDNKYKLAYDVAESGHRPPLRLSWNPALCCLLASCWCDNPTLRPKMGQVMSSLSSIMHGESGLITKETRSAPGKSAAASGEGSFDFVPGGLWRRMEIGVSLIKREEVLGNGS